MLDINKLFETMILHRNPKTKILSNSSNDGMLRFANISLGLLRNGNIIKRRKLLLKGTFKFFKTVLVQSHHIGAHYRLEQYVLNTSLLKHIAAQELKLKHR